MKELEKKGPLPKTKLLIFPFLQTLKGEEPKLGSITEAHITTTKKFIEAVYNEIKNNARKLQASGDGKDVVQI